MEPLLEFLNAGIFYNAAGMIGVLLYVGSYSALQFGKLDGNSIVYCLLNGCAASMVLISLIYDFNLASALIQVIWISVSLFGMCKYWFNRKNVQAKKEDFANSLHVPRHQINQ